MQSFTNEPGKKIKFNPRACARTRTRGNFDTTTLTNRYTTRITRGDLGLKMTPSTCSKSRSYQLFQKRPPIWPCKIFFFNTCLSADVETQVLDVDVRAQTLQRRRQGTDASAQATRHRRLADTSAQPAKTGVQGNIAKKGPRRPWKPQVGNVSKLRPEPLLGAKFGE